MRVFYDIDLPDDEGGGGGGSNAPAAKPPASAGPLVGKVSPKPVMTPPKIIPATVGTTPATPGKIPLPNYDDPKSRAQYAQNFYNQHPKIGHGVGDTPLRINEVPDTDVDKLTPKQMAVGASKNLGLDPALLYTSAMNEGMSGLWKDKNGQIPYSGDDKYPISGYNSFGLDTFSDAFPGLVKKGYLPADFQKNFNKRVIPPQDGDNKVSVNSADFKDANSAMQAKAAMIKMNYDDIDSYAKQRKIALSPKARDFFALVDYNGGTGTGHNMLYDYYNNGYLEGDKFMDSRPTTGKGLKADSYKQVYQNISQRLTMRDALVEQTLFDKFKGN
jgi:hypothetical protein